MKEFEIPIIEEPTHLAHYYGDIIRVLFLIAGVILLLSLPFFQTLLPIPFLIGTILVLAFLAGLTNPKLSFVIIVNLIISLLGFLIFEYVAVTNFSISNNPYAVVNQILAVIFFITLYYGTKTLRGLLIKDNQ